MIEIIKPEQIGYMEKRLCCENTRLIGDMTELCKLKQNDCIILLIHFAKAVPLINVYKIWIFFLILPGVTGTLLFQQTLVSNHYKKEV